jgi:hypothetical protein
MISSLQRRVVRFLFVLAFVPTLAFAQTPTPGAPFESIGRRLRVGHVAEVVDTTGLTVRGKVLEITGSKLVLTGGSGSRTFTGEDVMIIRRTGPIWDGAIKGALIAMVPIVIIAANCHGCDLAPAGAFWGGIGAGIGVGIDALFGPRTVYRSAAPSSRTVRLVPTLSRDRKGLSAAIAF